MPSLTSLTLFSQILPFLALGLGVDGMFLLAHTYSENMKSNIAVEVIFGSFHTHSYMRSL